MNPTSRYIVCEGREIHYTEWGAGTPALNVPDQFALVERFLNGR